MIQPKSQRCGLELLGGWPIKNPSDRFQANLEGCIAFARWTAAARARRCNPFPQKICKNWKKDLFKSLNVLVLNWFSSDLQKLVFKWSMISLYKMPGPHNPGMFAKPRGLSSLSNVAQNAVCKRQRNLPASLQNLGQLRLVHAITGDQAPVIPREGDLATWPNTCRTKLPVKQILYSLKCLLHLFVICVYQNQIY